MSALSEVSHVAGAVQRIAARRRVEPVRNVHTDATTGKIAIFELYTLQQAEAARSAALAAEERAPFVSWLVASAVAILAVLVLFLKGAAVTPSNEA